MSPTHFDIYEDVHAEVPCAVVFYPAKYAPLYPIGYKAAVGMAIACMLFTLAFKWLSLRRPTVQASAPSMDAFESEDGRIDQEDREKTGDTSKDEMPIVPVLRA